MSAQPVWDGAGDDTAASPVPDLVKAENRPVGKPDAEPLLSVEDIAKRRYLKEEVGLLDRHLRPDGGHDLIFRNDEAPLFDQNGEKIKRARTDLDWRERRMTIASEQSAASAIKAKVSE